MRLFLPVQSLRHLQQPLFEIAIDWRIAGGVGLSLLEETLETKLQRIHTQPRSDCVRVGLIRPCHLRRSEAAKRTRRYRVCVNTIGVHSRVRNPVGSEGPVSRFLCHPRTGVSVSSGIHIHFTVASEQAPITRDAAFDANARRMTRDGFEAFADR